MRVYLPSTLPGLAVILARGEAEPGPLRAFAVTPALREAYASGDEEELEYVAMAAAGRESLRMLNVDPKAPRRRAGKVPDMDAVTRVPLPVNEPVRQYQPGSADRSALEARIKDLAGQRAELTMTIGGRAVMGSGERIAVVQPHNHRRVLGELG